VQHFDDELVDEVNPNINYIIIFKTSHQTNLQTLTPKEFTKRHIKRSSNINAEGVHQTSYHVSYKRTTKVQFGKTFVLRTRYMCVDRSVIPSNVFKS